MSTEKQFDTSAPFRLRRNKHQASYSRTEIYDVLDQKAICNLSVVIEGNPITVPTLFARRADEILIHGSTASSVINQAVSIGHGIITVTHIDAIVLPDSIFEHSLDYRSVLISGSTRAITEPAEKLAALKYISESVLPRRYATVREPNANELRQTSVMVLAIDQAVLKSSTTNGMEIDSTSVWTGHLNLEPHQVRVLPSPSWSGAELPFNPVEMARKFL